ncbi:MAG: prephenate dehydrogenase [Gammaproteobacteria bacterium]|nr:MAG: prephenate dehydrogenase [Gammaproteobacteria bacterium]
MKPIKRLALIGVGMIGGSFIWSLKRAGMVEHVIGVDLNIGELNHAVELGIIDSKSHLDALHDVDAIVLATPVGAMQSIFNILKDKPFIRTAVITDVGSTKQSVIAAAQAGLGYLPANFVPGHPIAGREHIGVAHAEEMMFYGHRAILTPHSETDEATIATVRGWWEACGAHVDVMSPAHHDRVLAATSHLPHVLAYGIMESLATTEYEEPIFSYAAGGFKSFTRTASSNPIMWRDVCLNNKDDILYWLDHYQQTLTDLRAMIAAGDGAALVDVFERSKRERDAHLVAR